MTAPATSSMVPTFPAGMRSSTIGEIVGLVEPFGGTGGVDEGGGHRVDVDAACRPLEGQHLGEQVDPTLAGGIHRVVADADHAGLRAEVHDPALSLAEHDATGGAAAEEQPLEVDVHDLVPVGLGDVLGAVIGAESGVVDEDVDGPKVLADASKAASMSATSVTSR